MIFILLTAAAFAALRDGDRKLDAMLRVIDGDWNEFSNHLDTCLASVAAWEMRRCEYADLDAGDMRELVVDLRARVWHAAFALWSLRLAVSFPDLEYLKREHWQQQFLLESGNAQTLLARLAAGLRELVEQEQLCGWKEAAEIKQRCL